MQGGGVRQGCSRGARGVAAGVQQGEVQRPRTGEQSLGVEGEDGLDGAVDAVEAVGLEHALHQLLAVLRWRPMA